MPGSEHVMLWFVMTGLVGATLLGKFLGWLGIRIRFITRLVRISHVMTTRRQTEQQLLQLVKAVETMQLGVTITDLNGKILYTNLAEAKMHGYTVEELMGKDLGIFATPERRNPMTPGQLKQMKGLRESVNIRKDGRIFPVRLMSDIVKDGKGIPVALVTTCEDITEYKRAERKLQHHARELTLLNHMSDLLQACEHEAETYPVIVGVCRQLFPDDSGCLCILNPRNVTMEVVDFWGEPPHASFNASSVSCASVHKPDEQVHCTDFGVLCPHQVYCPYNECLSAPIAASGEILGLLSLCFVPQDSEHSDDTSEEQIESKQLVLNRIVEHYALSLANLRLREKLKIEAIRDPLTGLYNRRYMKDALEREAHRAERHNSSVGIIMLDLDHFKNFNDNYGHKAGDLVLRELGAFLLSHIRGEDIACRYGGEEFLLILPDSPLEITVQRAEQFRHGIEQIQVRYQEYTFRLSASCGVAAMPNHGQDIMQAVQQSDNALYQAKARGRNQVIVADIS